MKVNLVDASRYGQATIAAGAAVCYGSPPKDLSRIKRLKNIGHLATLRMAHAVIKVEEISVACQNQIVRSKHLDFLVKSLRYTKPTGAIVPADLSPGATKAIEQHNEDTFELYDNLLASGVKKEDARAVLPANTMTDMYIAGNLQAWVDFLKLRLQSHAQKEVREVAYLVWLELISEFPLVFSDLTFDKKDVNQWMEIYA